jgi:ribonuclease HI
MLVHTWNGIRNERQTVIRAAADGSALGNPGPAGWAWYVDDDCWAAGGWKHATNNQAELMAVLQLFRATAHLADDLLVLCDSQYVINCVTKWMPGWKKKGWRKADGKPVMNVELLKEIDEVLIGRRYLFEWVKGHDNHPLNEAADSRARAVSEAFQRGRPIPNGPGWVRQGEAGAPGAQGAGWSPGVSPAVPEPTLFGFEEAEETVVTIRLSGAEFERLTSRASSAGVTVEQALKSLI